MYWYNKGFYKDKPSENAKELSENEYELIMEKIGLGGELLEDLQGFPFAKETQKQKEMILENLRLKRQKDCFSVINRGLAWYKTLTAKQVAELDLWYQQWLDVTTTKQIPQKPYWIE